MMEKRMLTSLLLGLCCGLLSAQPRNVLVIIADDLGVDYMNKYELGADPAPTPVLDSMAENGILFMNAWTNPICSPSRANILTGKYGFRTGIGTAITSLQNTPLDTSEYTLAKAVRDQRDVATAMVGKWHLGHSTQAFRRNPNACGFDYYAGSVEGQLPNYSAWLKTVNGANVNVFQYATTVTVNDAISWIGSQSGDWMLFLTFNAPHEPFHRPPNNLHSFDGLSTNPTVIDQNPRPYFKAMIEAMDTETGRLLEYLRSSGQLDGTDIIFIGDNGSPAEVATAPFETDKMKSTLYNGGVRVPMIISGPSVVNPGRQAAELVNSTDIYHTVLELLGGNTASLPAGAAPDSRSLLPVITNSSDSGNQRPWIYGDFFKPSPPSQKDGKAITDGVYKLIEFDNGTTEFYNIATDPFENSPLELGQLTALEQGRYDFLCSELGTLVDMEFCQLTTAASLFENGILGLYPNPVVNEANISLSGIRFSQGSWNGRIYDSRGQLAQSFLINSPSVTVPVEQLPPSVYRLVIYENGIPVAGSSFVKQASGPVK